MLVSCDFAFKRNFTRAWQCYGVFHSMFILSYGVYLNPRPYQIHFTALCPPFPTKSTLCAQPDLQGFQKPSSFTSDSNCVFPLGCKLVPKFDHRAIKNHLQSSAHFYGASGFLLIISKAKMGLSCCRSHSKAQKRKRA